MGFELVALSTDQPAKIQPTIARHELGYTIYSDKSAAAARAYGIAFTMSAADVARYEAYGIDLEAASGETHHQLPVPAVFVYSGGKMVFQYVNPDYRVRVPAQVLLAALRSVKE
jgi:peroxiredoxin